MDMTNVDVTREMPHASAGAAPHVAPRGVPQRDPSAAAVARLAAAVARVFYRLEVVGPRPPARGPLLVVANHPNSLLDVALVTLATGRGARFLAKSTLWNDPKVAWLVRASGALPVYRHQDAPAAGNTGGAAAVDHGAGNRAMFEAAEGALTAGDAIALFPEGISHVRPSLAPLKTGAARLALGAARQIGGAFPLVPVGITLDDRETFRSAGLLVLGPAIAWDDLAAEALRGPDGVELDHALVRALTARIDRALHAVTASYESWDDARLITAAERVHRAAAEAARLGLPGSGGGPPLVFQLDPLPIAEPGGADRLERYHLGATLLATARAATGPAADKARARLAALAGELRAHERALAAWHLTPADLAVPSDVATAAGWARRRVTLPLFAALALAGTAVGWVPYRLTGVIAGRVAGTADRDVLATAKALVGGVCFLGWLLLLTAAAGVLAGGWAALATVVLGPALLLVALVGGERWQFAFRDARRFFTLRLKAGRVARLRAKQALLAKEVEDVGGVLQRLA